MGVASRDKLKNLENWASDRAETALIHVDAEILERDLAEFIREAWPLVDGSTYVHNWHIDAMADHLMAVNDGAIRKLLINIPPRCTKSIVVSGLWPAWTWAQNRDEEFPLIGPQVRFLCMSYAGNLALDQARNHHRVLTSPWYQARWGDRARLDKRQDRIDEFGTTARGIRYSVGFDGAILGRGGDIKIIDDPHNPEGVESEVQLEKVLRVFDEELTMRVTDPRHAAEIVLMQRLAQNDLSGHILDAMAANGDEVVHLMLPMEYDPRRHCVTVLDWEDPRGLDENGDKLEGETETPAEKEAWPDGIIPGTPLARAEGRLLWEERFPETVLIPMKTRLGPFAVAGRLQQLPQPRGGGILKEEWWRVWKADEYPDFSTVLVSLDTSSSAKEENDEIGLTAWGAWADEWGRPQIMLIDAWEGFAEFDPMVQRTASMCRAPNSNPTCPADFLLVEAKNVGEAVMQEVIRLNIMKDWQVIPINPTIDKVARARAVQHMFSGHFVKGTDDNPIGHWTGGCIWAPVTTWSDMVIQRCAQFPKAKRKGIVDTVTQAVRFLRDRGIILRVEEYEEEKRERELFRPQEPPPYEA